MCSFFHDCLHVILQEGKGRVYLVVLVTSEGAGRRKTADGWAPAGVGSSCQGGGAAGMGSGLQGRRQRRGHRRPGRCRVGAPGRGARGQGHRRSRARTAGQRGRWAATMAGGWSAASGGAAWSESTRAGWRMSRERAGWAYYSTCLRSAPRCGTWQTAFFQNFVYTIYFFINKNLIRLLSAPMIGHSTNLFLI